MATEHPSLPRPVMRADRSDYTTEEKMILRILDDTSTQSAVTYLGEPPELLEADEGPNPEPVVMTNRPIYDPGLEVDDRTVKYAESDATTAADLVDPEPLSASNPLDPVSPQLTTSAIGAEDPDPATVAKFPDDPSLTPGGGDVDPPPPDPVEVSVLSFTEGSPTVVTVSTAEIALLNEGDSIIFDTMPDEVVGLDNTPFVVAGIDDVAGTFTVAFDSTLVELDGITASGTVV